MQHPIESLSSRTGLLFAAVVFVACGSDSAMSTGSNVGFGGGIASSGAINGVGASAGANSGSAGRNSGGKSATLSGGSAAGGEMAAGGAGGNAAGGKSTGGGAGGNAAGGKSAGGGAGNVTGGMSAGGNAAAGWSVGGNASVAVGGSAFAGATSGGNAAGGVTSGAGRANAAGAAGSSKPCPTNGSVCKIMPFGDSITDGYGIAGGYRVELFRLAHQAGKNVTFVGTGWNGPSQVDGVNFPPNHEGHSGFTIDPTPSRSGISPLVNTVMPQFNPHVVLLMIGTNDAIDDYQLSAAPTRLGALIDGIYAKLPNVLIMVAQPIPSRDDALNVRIQSYNAAIPAVVKARADAGKRILLVDMYSVIAAEVNYKTTLLIDTWHPTVAGHARIGARWYESLAPLL